MRYRIKVIPNAKNNEIAEENGNFVVKIKAAPEKGKANLELIKFLSKYFNSKIRIVSGEKSRKKIIEVVQG